MEDFTESLSKTSSNEGPCFKKPVIIGKRPGGKVTHRKPATELQPPTSEGLSEQQNIVQDLEKIKQEIHQPVVSPVTSSKPVVSDKKFTTESDKDKVPALQYKEPSWSGLCDQAYSLEILKNGVIVTNTELVSKPFYSFGRLANSDFVLEHPSISRHHVVLQYRSEVGDGEESGWYLYDLNSTHGTFLNKQQLPPKKYCRIRAGHVFKLGVSTRMFVLQGPCEDQEPESELTVTQLLELRKKRESAMDTFEQEDTEIGESGKESATVSESTGIDWGMGEDASDENPQGDNPFAVEAEGPLNEHLYLEDPKKTLRGWFERENYELEYKVEERGYANFVCRVELPIETSSGAAVFAEAVVKGGKKKEAVVQCALEACRILDRHGLLRQSTHEAKRRKKKRYDDEDYYSSDEDTYLDRTGAVERKRQARMKAAGKASDTVETYESLTVKYAELEKELADVRSSLVEATSQAGANADEDDLDAYMNALQAEAAGRKKAASQLRVRLSELLREEVRLKKLINVTKPTLLLDKLRPVPSADAAPHGAENAGDACVRKSSQDQSPPERRQAPVTNEEPSDAARQTTVSAPNDAPAPPSRNPTKAGVQDAAKKCSIRPAIGPLLSTELLQQLKQAELEKEEEEKSRKKEVANSDDDGAQCDERTASGLVIRKRKKHAAKDMPKERPSQVKVEYDASDTSKYAMWVPPEDQVGDGKTALNKKLGY